MLWLFGRPVRIERIDAEAEALIYEFGSDAYAEARQKELESSSAFIARDWGRVARAVARRAGVPQMADSAEGAPDRENDVVSDSRSTTLELSPPIQPHRALPDQPQRFRVQFVDATQREPLVLKEIGVEAADVSAAIVVAAGLALPPKTNRLRIVDGEGREVFSRQRSFKAGGTRPTKEQAPVSLADRVRRLALTHFTRINYSALTRRALSFSRDVVQSLLPFLEDVRNWRRSP